MIKIQNNVVTGNKDTGEKHRTIAIATQLQFDKMWDGSGRLFICGDVTAIHRAYMGFTHTPPRVLRYADVTIISMGNMV